MLDGLVAKEHGGDEAHCVDAGPLQQKFSRMNVKSAMNGWRVAQAAR